MVSRRLDCWMRAILCATALLFPLSMHAHGRLKSSGPAANARLMVAPTELRLVFTEAPEMRFTSVALVGPAGPVRLQTLTGISGEPLAVVARIQGALVAGSYTVNWQTAGADGHPVRGAYTFRIDPGATGLTPVPAAGMPADPASSNPEADSAMVHHDPASMPSGGTFDAESRGYVALRWFQFTALLLVIGAVVFHYVVLGFLRRKQDPDSPMLPDARDRAARIGLLATIALAVAALLRLYAQSYALSGSAQVFDVGRLGALLLETTWGWGWLLQIVAIVLALIGFTNARSAVGEEGGTAARRGWALAALAALLLSFTPALSGHAAGVPERSWLAISTDALHVIGAAGWLGSLLYVLGAGIPAAMRYDDRTRWPAVADLVGSFSPTALVFSGLAGVTGVFAAWIHLQRVSDLWQSAYGQTLLVKLGILSLVVATGAYNWLRVLPALGDERGTARLRRSATIEIAVGVLVLGVTAVLVATPTPMDADMAADRENEPAMTFPASSSAGRAP